MSAISIVGGVYSEVCINPNWNQLWGSGGRAAAAIAGHVKRTKLFTYAPAERASKFSAYADSFGFEFYPTASDQSISFEYLHSLAIPFVYPRELAINRNPDILVEDDVVLRFGMMEGSAKVTATRCVYDPQSAAKPESFHANGSKAEKLALVANRGEVAALAGVHNLKRAAKKILKDGMADLVIAKCGPEGAYVFEGASVTKIAPRQTELVWPIGSGDVFAAAFALYWGGKREPAIDAAELASAATAEYVESMSLPMSSKKKLRGNIRPKAVFKSARVYLASPFFDLGQRWVVEEIRRTLISFGHDVFSPLHDVGGGPAEKVGPADLKALKAVDVIFAVLDGNDPGTIFEVGFARSLGKPVYAIAQRVSEEDLKMIKGSGCRVFDDVSTAIHRLGWRT